jgi:hypothetical protein
MKRYIFLFVLPVVFLTCIKAPHEVGWYLTLRIPGKYKQITIGEELEKSEKYRVIADSIFHIDRIIRKNLQNLSAPHTIFIDTLKRILPKVIDTTKSEFGSILFLMRVGEYCRGEVVDTPAKLSLYIEIYAWDEDQEQFILYETDTLEKYFTNTGNFEFTAISSYPNFPYGPHRVVVTPVIEEGAFNIDSMQVFKYTLFGANVLGDILITFRDTFKNKEKDVREAAEDGRIKRIFLHADVTHSFPMDFLLRFYFFDSQGNAVSPVQNIHFEPAPKNAEGFSTGSTTFSFELDLTEDIINLFKDTLIYYMAEAVIDSQGNVYIKPDDFIKLKGYLGVTVYTLKEEEK